MTQAQVFHDGEADQWFLRNPIRSSTDVQEWLNSDLLLPMLLELPLPNGNQVKVLEVGCGHGLRLKALEEHRGWNVNGIDPSELAVQAVRTNNMNAIRGV